MPEFNVRLKELRVEKNVTQKKLAEHLGIQPYSFQRLEYGTARPSLKTTIALADYFNVSLDYLVGRSDDRERH